MKVIQFDPKLGDINYQLVLFQILYVGAIQGPTIKTDDYHEGVGVSNTHFHTPKKPVPLTKP